MEREDLLLFNVRSCVLLRVQCSISFRTWWEGGVGGGWEEAKLGFPFYLRSQCGFHFIEQGSGTSEYDITR